MYSPPLDSVDVIQGVSETFRTWLMLLSEINKSLPGLLSAMPAP